MLGRVVRLSMTWRSISVRPCTLALPISSVLGNLFRASDLDAQTCDLVRKSATKLLTGACSLFAAKEVALTTTVNTLYAYRKFCASNNSTVGQCRLTPC